MEENLDSEENSFFAERVNELLIPPIVQDLNWLGKGLLFLTWIGSFLLPLFLLLTLNFNWYFEKL